MSTIIDIALFLVSALLVLAMTLAAGYILLRLTGLVLSLILHYASRDTPPAVVPSEGQQFRA